MVWNLTENGGSRTRILLLYSVIRLGDYLVGNRDDGILEAMGHFRGSSRLRSVIARFLRLFTQMPVSGWYDTDARHSYKANPEDYIPRRSRR